MGDLNHGIKDLERNVVSLKKFQPNGYLNMVFKYSISYDLKNSF
jgi:hypothetical protein